MFEIFKRSALPPFSAIESYESKDKYFTRTMQWDWLNEEMIHVTDKNAPRMITMDPWPQQVFLDADGTKTIREYIVWMANQYPRRKVPSQLDKEMIDVIEGLVKEGGFIELHDEKKKLPYYLNLPKSQQDSKKAIALMRQDGYLK